MPAEVHAGIAKRDTASIKFHSARGEGRSPLAARLAIICGMEIVVIGPDDADKVSAAAELFDTEPTRAATSPFLTDSNHHLLIAYEESVPVGFVSGVEITHPDKGTEMFLYELGVAADHRRRGIGRSLVERLADIARARDCYAMWVLTDQTNIAALTTYEHAGASREGDPQVLLSWEFNPTKAQRPAAGTEF